MTTTKTRGRCRPQESASTTSARMGTAVVQVSTEASGGRRVAAAMRPRFHSRLTRTDRRDSRAAARWTMPGMTHVLDPNALGNPGAATSTPPNPFRGRLLGRSASAAAQDYERPDVLGGEPGRGEQRGVEGDRRGDDVGVGWEGVAVEVHRVAGLRAAQHEHVG